MRTLIVEDEKLVREQIKYVLNSEPAVNVVGEVASVSDAVQAIQSHNPDLLLLDVELGDGTGFDILRQSNYSGQVIFITAYSNYAIKAFRAGAIDYLLKPLERGEFKSAFGRALDSQLKITQDQLRVAREMMAQKDHENLIVKTQEAIHVMRHEEIIFCKSDGSYTQFTLISGQVILAAKTLKEFEELLKKSFFFRCHRGYLVNLKQVQRITNNDQIALRNGSVIPLSFRKKSAFLQKLSAI